MKTVLPIMMIGVWAYPGLTAAQAAAPDKLVGTWWTTDFQEPVEQQAPREQLVRNDRVLTLRADSTWSTRFWVDGKELRWRGERVEWLPQGPHSYSINQEPGGRWRLIGDTLWFMDKRDKEPASFERRQVAFRGQQLVLGQFADSHGGECPLIMTSVDSTQSFPSVTPTSTVKRADLVGAWVSPQPRLSYRADTLAFRADSTWVHTRHTDKGERTKSRTGNWVLLPGDMVKLMVWDDSLSTYQPLPNAKIDLRGNQLTFYNGQNCDEARSWKVKAGQTEWVWTYDRIAP